MNKISKRQHRIMRHHRVRSKIVGTAERPRVSVFKSNRNIFIQFIDDISGKTLLSNKIQKDRGEGPVRSRVFVAKTKKSKVGKTEKTASISEMLADEAKKAGIKEVVFDRGGFKYHGRIKAVADGLRKGGIKL